MNDEIVSSCDFPFNEYGEGLSYVLKEPPKTIEVEVKSLIGNDDRAAIALSRELDPYFVSRERQRNHYFKADEISFAKLAEMLPEFCSDFAKKINGAVTIPSVRTRETDGDSVYLIFKASIGSGSSENGSSRIEHETLLPINMESLDSLLESAGLTVRSKWSRDRWTYKKDGFTICLDKNAGYGWLVEVEKMATESEQQKVKGEVLAILQSFGLEELESDRLERMFAHYEATWGSYYGTDKTFTLE
jgi:adenylate cyclase class IV